MTHMYFSARAEGRISYGHLGRTNSCCFCFDSFSRLFLVLSCTMCGMCRRPIHIAQQVKSFLSASMLLSVNLTFPSNTCRGVNVLAPYSLCVLQERYSMDNQCNLKVLDGYSSHNLQGAEAYSVCPTTGCTAC